MRFLFASLLLLAACGGSDDDIGCGECPTEIDLGVEILDLALPSTSCPMPLASGVGATCGENGVICSNCLEACSACTEIACVDNVWTLEMTQTSGCSPDGGVDAGS